MSQTTEHRPIVRVSRQLLNQPLACTEAHAVTVIAAIRSQLNVQLLTTIEGQQLDATMLEQIAMQGRTIADGRTSRRDTQIFQAQDGVAIIPVVGTLTKTWGLDPYSDMTGYDGIKAKLFAAMEDDSIEAILFDIDSPGGAVAGCFDLTDLIFACNKKNGGKLIYAVANEQMCSAAYAIGSAADELFVPRTGEVGSVGVLMIHSDFTKALDKEGIKVTVIRAGENKARGMSVETLDAKTLARFQESCDETRTLFIDTVARNLGISKKIVRETEASTYIGAKATGIGFATAVASDDQVWNRLMKRLGRT